MALSNARDPPELPIPPPSSSQDPPSPTQGHSALLRTHTHCLFSPSIAQNPLSPAQDAPSTAYSPSAHLRTPRATKHCSGPHPSTSQDPPELPLLPHHSSGCPKHHSGPLRTVQDPLSIAHSLPAQLRPTPPIAQCPPAHLRTPPASPIPPPSTVFAAFSPLWSRSVPREGPQAATSPCGAEAGRPQGERGLLRGIIGQGRAMLRQNTDGGPTRGGVGSVKGFAVLRRPHGDTEERNSALLRPLPQAAQAAWRTQRRAPPSRL